MGKGRRMREQRKNDTSAYKLPLMQAAKIETTVRILCVVCAVVLALSLLMPVWSVSIISQNLASEACYTAEETKALTPILPLGQLAMVLIPLGVVTTEILLWFRKTWLSLIGGGVNVVGCAMLVSFATTIGDVFAYNPLLHGGQGGGLDFWDLVLRYYILLIPTVMLIVAICMSFVARKKRDVADVIRNASDPVSTLSIDASTGSLSTDEADFSDLS